MKQAITIFLLLAGTTLMAQKFKPVDSKSQVKFSIKNVGIGTGGHFKGIEGAIIFDAAHLASSSFEVSVDANTIDTDIESRDKHLRSDDYFDVAKYPRITFKSDKISAAAKKGEYVVVGKLTIKGTTKEVSIPFTTKESADGITFEGSFSINRRDFKVGGNSMVLSDNVNVSLAVFAAKS